MPEYVLLVNGEYKPINQDDVDNYVNANSPKAANIRAVVRDAAPAYDPLTHRVVSGFDDDGATLTITQTAVALDVPTRAARMRAEAQRRIDLTDALVRERVQMECIALLAIAVRTPTQQTRLDNRLAWVNRWRALYAEGERLAGDANATPNWGSDPAGGV